MERFNTLEVLNMKLMLKASLAPLFAALLCLTFSLAAQTPTIPDTPAGRTLQAWFDAFNSGDRGRLEAYLKKYDPEKSVDNELNFRNQTGGFELIRIAKEFAYNLKNLKRATIIGETTGGGAHPVSGHRIDDHFGIGVPFARAINPITKTNWEGTGVEPDVKVPASEALEVAKKMAAEQIKKR
jgi:hypothetical protein